MPDRGCSILVHGPAGGGKSTFGSTGPVPILNLDVENSSRFLDVRRVIWNPMETSPPIYDGTWDMCVVKIRDWETAQKAYEYLKSGRHPFRTVMVDSISEIQVKAMESVNGRQQFQTQHWGRLLQNMGGFLRDLRDLVGDDRSTLELMVLISTSREVEDKDNPGEPVWKPFLQGSIAQQVPYLFDVTGYLYSQTEADPVTGEVRDRRYLFTGKHPKYEAKNRVRNFPPLMPDPNLATMMDMMFGPEENPIQPVAPSGTNVVEPNLGPNGAGQNQQPEPTPEPVVAVTAPPAVPSNDVAPPVP